MSKLHSVKVFDDRAKEVEIYADRKGYPIDEDTCWVFICTRVTEIDMGDRPNTIEEWARIYEWLGIVIASIEQF